MMSADMDDPRGVAPHTPRLLLCDDSPVERLAVGHFLRSTGYRVDEVADGASCIHFIQNRQIDLLLLDLHMPEVDGFAVLKYLQQHHGGLSVILMSGMPPDQIQHKMHLLPRHELPMLLIKPIDFRQLHQMIEMQLAGELDVESVARPDEQRPDAT